MFSEESSSRRLVVGTLASGKQAKDLSKKADVGFSCNTVMPYHVHY